MYRIPSLTERVLLHPLALDLFAPSDFQKLRIPVPQTSILETLRLTKKNLYTTSKNTSYLYRADQFFILTLFKVVSIAAVTLTVSRLGMMYHGCATVYSGFKTIYHCLRVTYGDEGQFAEHYSVSWKKTQAYAFACLSDSVSALLGSAFTPVIVECTMRALHFSRLSSVLGKCQAPPLTSLIHTIMSLALVVFAVAGFIHLQSYELAPHIFAPRSHNTGMYLALFFRKNLGLVNSQGGLLPFSKKDRFSYQERDGNVYFRGKNFSTLHYQLVEAEYALIDAVVAWNKQFQDAEFQISFSYPFNGIEIVEALKTKLPALFSQANPSSTMVRRDGSNALSMIEQFKSLQLKIVHLKQILIAMQKLSYEDSFFMTVLKQFFKRPDKRLLLNENPLYIPKEEYLGYFTLHTSTHFSMSRGENSFISIIEQTHITAINPSEVSRPNGAGILATFSYDIAVNKWKIENGQRDSIQSPQALLGLTEQASRLDYRSIKRKYSVTLHPDKGGDETLFECFTAICEQLLEEEYK